jgi:hypothetical protein
MVRRWSCINISDFKLNQLLTFNKNTHLSFLKNSTYHKKFTIKFTKFNRRILSQWKRRSNWFPYSFALNHWCRDYLFCKNFVKFQFLFNSFKNFILFYNYNYIKKKKTYTFQNVYNFGFVGVSRHIFKYFDVSNFSLSHLPLLFSFVYKKNLFKGENFLNFYLIKENSYFPINQIRNREFNLNFEFTNLINQFALFKIIEIYKSLIILFYIKIK